MTVERYDFSTIDFSVEGWDTLFNNLVAMLQDLMVTREIVTLGETVTAYQALYQKATDSKWYKALSDGSKQPCQGIAIEGGDVNADEVIGTDTLNYTCIKGHTSNSDNKPITGPDWTDYWVQAGSSGVAWVNGIIYYADEIRIHRMGKLTNPGWTWGTIGAPIYLDGSTAGALTQTPPATNAQIVGFAMSATSMIVVIGIESPLFSRGETVLSPSGAINVIVWEAPFACTVKTVKGYRVGGTGATINARLNGSSNHLASALSLTSADTWMDGGAVQNTVYAAGDKMEIMVVTVAGSPDQVAVQVNFVRK